MQAGGWRGRELFFGFVFMKESLSSESPFLKTSLLLWAFWCCPFTSPAFLLKFQNRIGSGKNLLALSSSNYHNAQEHSDNSRGRWLTSVMGWWLLRCCPLFSTILWTGFRKSFYPGINLYEASEDTNMPLFLFLGAFPTRPQLFSDSYLLPTNLGRLCNIFVKIFYIDILCVGWMLLVLSFLNCIKICCELSFLGVTMAA